MPEAVNIPGWAGHAAVFAGVCLGGIQGQQPDQPTSQTNQVQEEGTSSKFHPHQVPLSPSRPPPNRPLLLLSSPCSPPISRCFSLVPLALLLLARVVVCLYLLPLFSSV
ncbi:hypothetical protein BDQ94DRAFT_144920, partial [Aspergillus welwitschiae]